MPPLALLGFVNSPVLRVYYLVSTHGLSKILQQTLFTKGSQMRQDRVPTTSTRELKTEAELTLPGSPQISAG